ncbi:MAG: hypothetical protein V4456_12500 [Bacteroidota bacterium]
MNQALLIGIITALNGVLHLVFQIIFSEKIKKKFGDETEALKLGFNKELEKVRADFAKQNITYQIEKSEFSKKKFESITGLYSLLLELQTLTIETIEYTDRLITTSDLINMKEKNLSFQRKVTNAINVASLFTPKSVTDSAQEFNNNTFYVMKFFETIRMHDILSSIGDISQYEEYGEGFDLKQQVNQFNQYNRLGEVIFKKVTTEFADVLKA